MNHVLASRMESGPVAGVTRADASSDDLLKAADNFIADAETFKQEQVVEITREFGCDFATAVLYRHFHNRLPDDLKTPGMSSCNVSHKVVLSNTTLAIVPGALYRQRPDVGGDGEMLREAARKNDWPVELIPTNGIGRVDENAMIVRKWLAEYSNCSNRKIVLVSLSKGSADTLAAVFAPGRSIPENIAGWINVSGIPFGTPMVNWMMKRWLFRRICQFACRIRGADIQAVRDLAYDDASMAWLTHSKPEFPIYHIAGFPREEHLSCRRARLWYHRFKNHGPTDSVFMLSDLLRIPGIVIPVWGADHYLKSGWAPERVFASIIKHFMANESGVENA